jgi:formyltetrahydrofolate-dependent phosphoribosylglycinamide formyltransferase
MTTDIMTNINTPPHAVAVFISGTGSNMKALIEACHTQTAYPAKIGCVISDKADAGGLKIAQDYQIKTYFVDPKAFSTKQAYEQKLHTILQENHIDFICLAGFMRLLSPYLCDLWAGKMINIHPSLLPAFKGLNTHQRAIDAGVKFSGCTIHYVSSKMDSGTIIAQAITSVFHDDTAESLAKRILRLEHKLYPLVLKALCDKNTNYDKLCFYDSDKL